MIKNPIVLFIAIVQLGSAAYFWIILKSPLLGLLQLTYAISNVITSMMKGL